MVAAPPNENPEDAVVVAELVVEPPKVILGALLIVGAADTAAVGPKPKDKVGAVLEAAMDVAEPNKRKNKKLKKKHALCGV